MINEGQNAPDFCLPDYEGRIHCLKDFRGKWLVLYFYPRDNTSGCTREARDFTERKDEFGKLNAVIVGISKDSPASHRKFVEKQSLQILLLSDEKHEVIERYGVWGKKKRYGREYYGTVRSTLLISPDGKIVKIWKNVRVAGHVDDVLKKLKEVVENGA
ncbi:MAG: peroxiredoxin [Thermoplasmata archaeon]|nr:peroxiredoxin [Thermoplasmata archaeon]